MSSNGIDLGWHHKIYPYPGADDIFNDPDRSQQGLIYDMLSEGEIDGLVNGASSIFLNDTPLIDEDVYEHIKPRTTRFASITAGQTTASVNSAEAFFDGIQLKGKTRFLRIEGAGKSTTSTGGITFSITKGTNYVIASSSFFVSDMQRQSRHNLRASIIRIPGAGIDGMELDALITSVDTDDNGLKAYLDVIAHVTVSGVSCAIDHASKITAINEGSDECTLEVAAITTVSNVRAQLLFPVRPAYTNDDPNEFNFKNSGASFLTGHANQPIIPNLNSSTTSTSYVLSVNTEMKQQSGLGEGTASDVTITASQVQVADASLIDEIKLTFEFPQGLYSLKDEGDEGPNWSELQIYFDFVRNSNEAFGGDNEQLVFGRPNSSGDIGGQPWYDGFSDGGSGADDKGNHLQASDAFIIARTRTSFAEEFTINTRELQPFTDWRIKVKKVNSDNHEIGNYHWTFNGITMFKTVEAIIKDKFRFPNTAYSLVTFNAEDFNSPPSRSYHLRGLKIQVPSNYITREEASDGIAAYKRNITTGAKESSYQNWDGNFRGDTSTFTTDADINHRKVYCNNPAWIFYDLVTNKTYGLGNVIQDDSLINKYELYKIARYCDELVPDGRGDKEPRFTCNVYIKQASEAYQVLNELASVFRGLLYWMDGKLTPIQDRPKLPTYTFNQTNVIDGEFAYTGTSNRKRPNQIAVTWTNPDNKYTQEVKIVEDVDNILETNELKTEDALAFGCTSEGQAWRVGQWYILTNKLETEIVGFKSGLGASFVRAGDIVNVQDHNRYKVQFSGRVAVDGSIDENNIPLDRPVSFYPESNYTLHLIFPSGGAFLAQDTDEDGNLTVIGGTTFVKGDYIIRDKNGALIDSEIKTVNIKDDNNNPVRLEWSEHTRVENQLIGNPSGTIDETTGAVTTEKLFVLNSFSEIPNTEVIWAITSDERDGNESDNKYKTVQYRVLDIVENTDEGTFEFSAVKHIPTKFDEVEKGYAIYETPYDLLPGRYKPVPGPTDVRVTFSNESGAGSDGATQDSALIQWGFPVGAKANIDGAKSPLYEELSVIDGTITVKDGTDFASSGVIQIDDEFIKYTGKSTNDLTGCTRGAYRTKAVKHKQIKGTATVTWVFQAEEIILSNNIGKFEVKHNLANSENLGGGTGEIFSTNNTQLKVVNPLSGFYLVSVRVRTTEGQVSSWTTISGRYAPSMPALFGRYEKLIRGGHMTGSFVLNTSTGNVNTAADNYIFTNSGGKQHPVSSASTDQEIQAFSGLSSGGIGYLIHDSSDNNDPWKALDIYTDRTALFTTKGQSTTLAEALDTSETEIDLTDASDFPTSGTIAIEDEEITYTGKSTNTLTGCTRGAKDTTAAEHDNSTAVYYGFQRVIWWKEVGASNKGLTLASGTVSIDLNSNKVTGSSTNFDGNFKVGDFIRIANTNNYGLQTSAFYSEVTRIVSDTEMYLTTSSSVAFSSKYAYYQSWKPDFTADTVVAKITRTS